MYLYFYTITKYTVTEIYFHFVGAFWGNSSLLIPQVAKAIIGLHALSYEKIVSF